MNITLDIVLKMFKNSNIEGRCLLLNDFIQSSLDIENIPCIDDFEERIRKAKFEHNILSEEDALRLLDVSPHLFLNLTIDNFLEHKFCVSKFYSVKLPLKILTIINENSLNSTFLFSYIEIVRTFLKVEEFKDTLFNDKALYDIILKYKAASRLLFDRIPRQLQEFVIREGLIHFESKIYIDEDLQKEAILRFKSFCNYLEHLKEFFSNIINPVVSKDALKVITHTTVDKFENCLKELVASNMISAEVADLLSNKQVGERFLDNL